METIADSASPDGAGRIAKLLRQLPESALQSGGREQLLAKAVTNLSQANPAQAAEFLEDNPQLRSSCGADILRNWGWIEGPVALAWLERYPSTTDPSEFQALWLGWAEKDSPAAATYILNHLDDPRVHQSVDNAAFGLFFVDKDLALSWAEKLPAEIRATANLEIANYYWGSDPTAAAEWSVQLPVDERNLALSVVLREWSNTNPDLALTWINSSSGTLRDEALEVFCRTLSGRTPTKAIELANTMADQARRESTLQAILENWLQTSSDEAAAWIRSSFLPARQKPRCLLTKENTIRLKIRRCPAFARTG